MTKRITEYRLKIKPGPLIGFERSRLVGSGDDMHFETKIRKSGSFWSKMTLGKSAYEEQRGERAVYENDKNAINGYWINQKKALHFLAMNGFKITTEHEGIETRAIKYLFPEHNSLATYEEEPFSKLSNGKDVETLITLEHFSEEPWRGLDEYLKELKFIRGKTE